MSQNQVPNQSHEINNTMWKTLMSVRTESPTQTIAEDHALFELSQLTEHRHTRLLESALRIPTVLWFVLIIGAIVTIASASSKGKKGDDKRYGGNVAAAAEVGKIIAERASTARSTASTAFSAPNRRPTPVRVTPGTAAYL